MFPPAALAALVLAAPAPRVLDDFETLDGWSAHPSEGVELRIGQEKLYRRLYAPEAFEARLLGNLSRFRDVKYRPEAVQLTKAATFFRLLRHYWGLGKAAHRFFWRILGKTVRHSRRSTRQMVQFLGMYKHFCEVHGRADSWNPWAKPAEAAAPAPKPAPALVEAPKARMRA